MIADKPLINEALLNVSAIHSSGKPRFLCSETIHASKPVKRMHVVIPPRNRETHKMPKLLKCSQMLMMISSTK